MAYISQMGVMRQKVEWCKEEGDKEKGDKEEEVTFSKVRTYYRNSLLTIQNALPRMLPERHQYRAEAQTWASFCEFCSNMDIRRSCPPFDFGATSSSINPEASIKNEALFFMFLVYC